LFSTKARGRAPFIDPHIASPASHGTNARWRTPTVAAAPESPPQAVERIAGDETRRNALPDAGLAKKTHNTLDRN